MLDGAHHERVIVEKVDKIGQLADGHVFLVVLDKWNQHLVDYYAFFFVFGTEGGDEHFLEIGYGHQPSLIFNAFIHSLPHIVENSIIHAQFDHLVDNSKFVMFTGGGVVS